MIGSALQAYKQAFTGLNRSIWVLAAAMLINRSGSMVLLFGSLYFTRDLGYSISTAGLVMSFYGIGSVLGSYAGGWLTDKRDYFSVMLYSLLVSGLILFLFLVWKDPVSVSALLFVYAFTSDIFRPANSAAIAVNSTPETRTRSVSLVRLAVNLGFSIGPAAGGIIAYHYGYHWLFVADACTTFGAAWMLYAWLPRKPGAIPKNVNQPVPVRSASAYTDPHYMLFVVLVAMYGTAFFQLFASVPQYFSKVCGYTEDLIGVLLALNGLLVVLIEMPLIARIDNRSRWFSYMVWGSLCIPAAFLFLQFGYGLVAMSLIYTLVITLSEILAMPFMMNFALSRPARDRQGQYSALYSISYGIANIAAPPLGLAIAGHFGFFHMFSFFSIIAVLAAIGFYYLGRRVHLA